MNTPPSGTAGADSPIDRPVAYFHFSLPAARSIASRSPFADPTYTTPSAMAADDSIASPASNVQCSFRAAGGTEAAMPVSRGFPRNSVQRAAGSPAGQAVGTGCGA